MSRNTDLRKNGPLDDTVIGERILYFADDPSSVLEGSDGCWFEGSISSVTRGNPVILPKHRVVGTDMELYKGLVPLVGVPVVTAKWVFPIDQTAKILLGQSMKGVVLSDDRYKLRLQLEGASTEQLVDLVSAFIQQMNIARYKWPGEQYKNYHTPRQRQRLLDWLTSYKQYEEFQSWEVPKDSTLSNELWGRYVASGMICIADI